MSVSRFEIRLTCACGQTTEFQSALARPGRAPLPCSCGRKFAIQQLDESEVASIAIDPTGATGGDVSEEPPDLH